MGRLTPVKLEEKSILTRRIKRQLLGRVNRSSKLRLSDLLLTAKQLVSNARGHRFLKNLSIRNRVAVQDGLTNAQKDRRINCSRRHFFLNSQKIFSAPKRFFPFHLVRNCEEFTFTEKQVKDFHADFLHAHPVLPRGSVTIWDCMSYRSFGCLEPFSGTMDSQHQVEATLKITWAQVFICFIPLETVFSDKTIPHLTLQESHSNGLR